MKLIVCSNNIDFLNKLDSSFDLKDFQIVIAKSIDKIISSLSHKSIIIMDHVNDDFDAIEASNIIRETNTLTYIIIRSNSNENFLKIAAYNNGCNDFVSFDLSAHILFKKIKTIVDFIFNETKENIIYKEFNISLSKRTILNTVTNDIIELPNKQFELLVELSSFPGKVFKRELLYRKVWGGELFAGNRTLDVHIRGLRSKLLTDYIRTVKGVGYKLI
jgi:two-component system alkaline phosphatase synthesis response regulator PhoP